METLGEVLALNRAGGEQSGAMSAEGKRITARRDRLGLTGVQLAAAAGIHRTTLAALEGGQGSTPRTVAKVKATLDRLEAEQGIESPMAESAEEGLVEIEVDGNRVIVRGPVADRAALAETVARLIRGIREEERNSDDSA